MNRLPILVTLVVGWFLVVDAFVPHRLVSHLGQRINTWVPIVASVALALGAISLFQLHWGRLVKKHPDRMYSAVTLVAMLVTVAVGLLNGPGFDRTFQWIYDFVFVPLRATMFSLLAFYLASAAYRAFRVRSREALVLFVAAFVVMLGNIPATATWFPWLPPIAQWVLHIPMTAAMRALTIGVGLGLVVLSVRILLGRDRSYLGGNG